MDFITNENSLPKQVVINKDNIEILQTNMETVVSESDAAVAASTAASAKADIAYTTANTVQSIAIEAKSTADSAYSIGSEALIKSTSAQTTADAAILEANSAYNTATAIDAKATTALEKAEINEAAIDALGEFDAEAIANLTKQVEANTIEISTVVSQVDAAEDDIADMKQDIQNNATGVNTATAMAAEASTYAADAYSRANTGVTNAAAAQATANSASEAAYNAESAANAAQLTADEALSKTGSYIYDETITSYSYLSSAIGQGILNGRNLGYNRFEIIINLKASTTASYSGQMTGVVYDDGTLVSKTEYYTVTGYTGTYDLFYVGSYNFGTGSSQSVLGRTLQYTTNTYSTTIFSSYCSYGATVRVIATKYD